MRTQPPAESIAPATALNRRRSLGWSVSVAGLCYLALAVVVTVRLWRDPASLYAGNVHDNDLFAWFLRYEATAVAHLRLPALVTNALNAPQGINLMWNTAVPLLGVLLAPVTLLAGPQVSLTLLLTLGFAGSATALYGVLISWDVPARYAALGGFVFGFSPALMQSSFGHYHLQFEVLSPLIVSATLRLLTGTYRHGPVRCGLWLGVLLAMQLLIAEEPAFEVGIGIAVAAVVLALSRPGAVPGRLGDVGRGLAAAAFAVAVCAGYPLYVQFFGPLKGHSSAFRPDFFKNDLYGFVEPSARELLHTSGSNAFAGAHQGGVVEYLAYLGWPLLIAVLVFTVLFWRVLAIRMAAVTFLVLSVLSLGGTLLADGHEYSRITLPWYWVQTTPVVGSALNDRFSIFADLAAAAVLAWGLAEWHRRAIRQPAGHAWFVLAAGVIAVVPLIPNLLPATPVATVPSGWQTAFAALRLPAGVSVLTVPIATQPVTEPMRWRATTGEPISLYGGYFLGPSSQGRMQMDGIGLPTAANDLNQLWSASSGQSIGNTPSGPVHVSIQAGRMLIAQWNPAAVMAVTSQDSVLGRYLIGLLGKPTVISGSVLAWRR
jgi:hypothetical protein